MCPVYLQARAKGMKMKVTFKEYITALVVVAADIKIRQKKDEKETCSLHQMIILQSLYSRIEDADGVTPDSFVKPVESLLIMISDIMKVEINLATVKSLQKMVAENTQIGSNV